MLAYASKPELLSLVIDGDRATAQVYERTEISWVAKVQPEVAADQQRNPARYRVTPVGPRGETASGVGIRHELTLTRAQSGWRVSKDAFDEYMLYLTSPDVVPGSWADEHGKSRMPTPGVPDHSSIQETTPTLQALSAYNHGTAQTAALNNALTYNNNFCSYRNCGNDCANFVSECFNAGGLQPTGPWTVEWKGCYCNVGTGMPSVAYQGTDTWANNRMLRDWMNSTSGRGTSVTSWTDYRFTYGDYINYRWNDVSALEDVHHITICTGFNGTGPLICSHTTDYRNVPYNIRPNNTVFFTYSIVY